MTFDRTQRSECRECPAFADPTSVYVGPEIRPGSPIMLLAERPGETEAENGIILSGKSGKLSDGLLMKAGLDRMGVSLANTCCCFRKGNPTPTATEIKACAGLVEKAILEARPRVIVALGGTAIARMVGERAVGKWQGSVMTTPSRVMVGEERVMGPDVFKSGQKKGQPRPHLVETFVDQPSGRTVVVTFHPAALLDSGLAEYPLVVSALKRAKALSNGHPLIEVGESIIAYPQDASVAGVLLEHAKECVLDVEADRDTGRMSVIGLAPSPDYGVTFEPTSELHEILRRAFAEPDRTFIGQNLAYDTHQLETYRPWRLKKLTYGGWSGREWADRVEPIKVECALWDTHHASFYERPELVETIKPHALEQIASRTNIYRYDNWKERYRSGEAPSIFAYNALDCCWTAAIWEEWRGRLAATGRLPHFERNMMPALRTLIDVERDGVQIDRTVLTELHERQSIVFNRLESEWNTETGGVNYASQGKDGALRKYIHGTLGLPVQYKGRGRKRVETLDEEACENLYRKFPHVTALRILIHLRHAKKMLSTYFDPILDESGRLHPECDLSGAITGRHSGSMQQVPRTSQKCEADVEGCVCGRTREMFVCDDGDVGLAVADKRQVEFRMWGVVSGDSRIRSIFDNPDSDIHQWAADKFQTPRKIIKHVVHGGMFLAGAKKVSDFTGMPIERAYLFLDALRQEFAETFRYQAHVFAEARKLGYITTKFGRRVPFQIREGKLKETEVAAAIVQSPTADCLNVDAWRIRKAGLKTRWLLHDEAAVSMRSEDDAQTLREVMEMPYEELGGWMCPCDLGIGRTWATAKENAK